MISNVLKSGFAIIDLERPIIVDDWFANIGHREELLSVLSDSFKMNFKMFALIALIILIFFNQKVTIANLFVSDFQINS